LLVLWSPCDVIKLSGKFESHDMDLTRTITELRSEKEKLVRVIASLEELQNGVTIAAPRRGRKSMSLEERREVSARMKKYWAAKRGRGAGR